MESTRHENLLVYLHLIILILSKWILSMIEAYSWWISRIVDPKLSLHCQILATLSIHNLLEISGMRNGHNFIRVVLRLIQINIVVILFLEFLVNFVQSF
jgi:hypothetical protein